MSAATTARRVRPYVSPGDRIVWAILGISYEIISDTDGCRLVRYIGRPDDSGAVRYRLPIGGQS